MAKATTLLLLVALCVTLLGSAHAAEYHHSLSVDDGHLRIGWVIKPPYILFNLEFDHPTWLAIGFPSEGGNGMDQTDMIVVQPRTERLEGKGFVNLTVSDMWSEREGQAPKFDTTVGGKVDIHSYSVYQDWLAGSTMVQVRRALDTGDAKDVKIENRKMKLVWAHGEGTKDTTNRYANYQLKKHTPRNRGQLLVNFFTGEVDTELDLKSLHGSLMMFAFAFCMPFGAFVARYLKEYNFWFFLHLAVQVIGFLAATSAWIIALIMVEGHHFANTHAIMGQITYAITFVVPILGFLADRYYDSKRTHIPVFPDRVHHYSARLSMLLAIPTIVLGLTTFGVRSAIIIVFAIAVGFWVCVTVLLELTAGFQRYSEFA